MFRTLTNMINEYEKQHNDGLQLRRAISIQAERKGTPLRRMLSRRQLQGFVRRAVGKDISSQI
jgi:hypothetical protein